MNLFANKPADLKPMPEDTDFSRADDVAIGCMTRIKPALEEMGANIPALRAMLTNTLYKTRKLCESDAPTLDAAVLRGAALGLALGDEWYLVPRKISGRQSAEFQLGYKGEVTLGYRTGLVDVIRFGYLRDSERIVEYDEPNGVLRLALDPLNPDGNVTAYWCVVEVKGGHKIVKMTGRHVAERQMAEAAEKNFGKVPSTWANHFDAMALRHPIKQALKPLPRSSDFIAVDLAEAGASVREVVSAATGKTLRNLSPEVAAVTAEPDTPVAHDEDGVVVESVNESVVDKQLARITAARQAIGADTMDAIIKSVCPSGEIKSSSHADEILRLATEEYRRRKDTPTDDVDDNAASASQQDVDLDDLRDEVSGYEAMFMGSESGRVIWSRIAVKHDNTTAAGMKAIIQSAIDAQDELNAALVAENKAARRAK